MTKRKEKTKPVAKAAPKNKPVTVAERVKRIELDVNRHGVGLDTRVRQLHDLVAVITAQLGRMEPKLDKIEREVSLIRSGASFMQELEAQPTKEQGLEHGDYCSGTPKERKEMADKLTEMGYPWHDKDRTIFPFLRWGIGATAGSMVNEPHLPDSLGGTELPRPEFLSRAAVTAKRIGLVPVGLPAIEVGDWVKPGPNYNLPDHDYQWPMQVVWVESNGRTIAVNPPNRLTHHFSYEPSRQWVTKLTPEEVAAYKQQEELAKPIVPYETRVKYEGKEWRVIALPDADGDYRLHRIDEEGDSHIAWVKRHQFTVIP